MRFSAIDRQTKEYSIRWMCQKLEVCPAGFYAWRRRGEKKHGTRHTCLLTHIRAAHQASHRAYGSPRIHRELVASGIRVVRHRVARVMRLNGITGVRKRRFVRTTHSRHMLAVAPDLLKRDFSATAPNQKWVTDITYLRTPDGWVFLAAIIDLFSRRVVGWSMAEHMDVALPLAALRKALASRNPPAGLIHHSDRGSQYASGVYQRALAAASIRCSMSRKGECWDNSVAESFFGRLKEELVYRITWQSRAQITAAVESYIQDFDNSKRRHSTLAFRSPIDYEVGASRDALAT